MDHFAWALVRDTGLLRRAFDSCARVFPPDEIDPWEWWLDEFRRTEAGAHRGPYSCLVCLDAGEIVGGITWNRYALGHSVFGAIGFDWVEPERNGRIYRGKGIGRRNFEEARKRLHERDPGRDGGLLFCLLESNTGAGAARMMDSRPFWGRLGFVGLPGIEYCLPCLAFDPATGSPLTEDIPLELMLRPEGSPPAAPGPALVAAIETIYFDWYAPTEGEFANPAAYSKAREYVSRRWDRIRASIPADFDAFNCRARRRPPS